MSPVFFWEMEEELFMLIPALLSGIPSALFGIACFILSAMALYTIASRRGIRNAWLSWVPVVNCWILGSLSDQYQYVVKGQNKTKRKLMLVLNLLTAIFSAMVTVLAAVTVAGIFFGRNDAQMMRAFSNPSDKL